MIQESLLASNGGCPQLGEFRALANGIE